MITYWVAICLSVGYFPFGTNSLVPASIEKTEAGTDNSSLI